MKNRINNLRKAIQGYYQLAVLQDEGHDVCTIDAGNRCFEILEKEFGWDLESEDNTDARIYFLRATDKEAAEYLFDHVLEGDLLHHEARELMHELDDKYCQIEVPLSLDDYYAKYHSILSAEDCARIDWLMNQWNHSINGEYSGWAE